MAPETEKKEEIVYKADPFTFIFRELDLMHNEIREVKGELVTINKRIDDLYKFIITMNDSINKRFDRLYIIVILIKPHWHRCRPHKGIFLLNHFLIFRSNLEAIPVPFYNYLKILSLF